MISVRNLALILIIIGAVNWGLIGFFRYDLVSSVFGGNLEIVSRVIFAIVGLAGLYAISFFFRNRESTQS
ncbi:DUF378 domain-containing protein [Clostridiales bacterium BAD-6]|uniref:DUF378 domain-containing protein n=1 Tax=Sinanaerobacter chloroacetimidivorans TaxID=2818044 RepID=A0A8J7VYT4_9FIRM|nr:DUF378 domain-containing protein [Sinanaerobacter chloroacetimidivorans]MBR0597569.1 DUF378 domain-containing protein [Sinanaerobacter chloroacetimidivorans]